MRCFRFTRFSISFSSVYRMWCTPWFLSSCSNLLFRKYPWLLPSFKLKKDFNILTNLVIRKMPVPQWTARVLFSVNLIIFKIAEVTCYMATFHRAPPLSRLLYRRGKGSHIMLQYVQLGCGPIFLKILQKCTNSLEMFKPICGSKENSICFPFSLYLSSNFSTTPLCS